MKKDNGRRIRVASGERKNIGQDRLKRVIRRPKVMGRRRGA